jgi:hypothetical protein
MPAGQALPVKVMPIGILEPAFSRFGCLTQAVAEYDVRYWLSELDSFILFLKAVPLPERFDPEAHYRAVKPRDLGLRLPARH